MNIDCDKPTSQPTRRSVLLSGVMLAALPEKTASARWQSSPHVWLDGGGGFGQSLRIRQDVDSEFVREAVALSNSAGHRALLVWHRGQLLVEHYSQHDDADTLVNGFSMAKTVLAMMYGLSLSKGVITTLDDPVGRYLSQWADDPRGQITLRQLLQMRSGLHLYSLARSEPEAIALLSGPDATATALQTPLDSKPDTVFRYANVNSQIAGAALQAALKGRAGLTYPEAIQAWLWQPLGLGQARLALDRLGGSPRYFAGMEATARDWLGLGTALFEGDVLPSGWAKVMGRASAHAQYGLHIWRGEPWAPRRHYGDPNGPSVPVMAPYLTTDMLVMDGAGGQRTYVSPSHELVIVRFGIPSWDWEDSALPNLVLSYLQRL